jgi:hypothetical protein
VVGVELGDVRVIEELRVCPAEDAPCVHYKVKVGDMLPDLPSGRGVGGKGDLDWVGKCCEHCVGCRV